MCGLAGHFGPRELSPQSIERTLRLMRHRGPDDQTHERHRTPSGELADLLHARLTIIDLDPRSNQPFHRGSLCLAYNGELYNYLELRAQLEREGARFETSSDTEVLAAVIERWGWEALDRCEGMWAFAAHDRATGVLRLCSDRFGEKPMLVYRDGADTFFGSEAKLVFSLLGRTPPANVRHLQRYLVNGYKSLHKTADTFFEGLEELPAGSWRPARCWSSRPTGSESGATGRRRHPRPRTCRSKRRSPGRASA